MLEVVVAMVIFGVALAGLFPLMVMQLRILRKLEWPDPDSKNLQVIRGVRIVNGQAYYGQALTAPTQAVLQPQRDVWARRVGPYATFQSATSHGFTSPPVQIDKGGPDVAIPSGWQPPAPDTNGEPWLAKGGTATALWSFPSIVPGRYNVYVSYASGSSNATDAKYVFADGGPLVGGLPPSPQADQTTTPSDASGNPPYKLLGVYNLGPSFQINLGGSTTGRVVAGAVRLTPYSPLNTVTITSHPTSTNLQVSVTVSNAP